MTDSFADSPLADDLTLAEWMTLALYDPRFGYYTSGAVSFGDEAHFWTFPERLSPTFGRVVARHLVAMHRALLAAGALSPGERFVVLELGAGEGWLAEDVLGALDELAPLGDPFAACAAAVAYRIGDRAPALRERQRARLASAFGGGRAAHLAQGPDELMPTSDPFVGVVLSNELFDVYPHELLRVPAPGQVERLHLTASVHGRPLGRDALIDLAATKGPDPRVHGGFAPWDPPPATVGYLAAIEPVLAHRRALGLVPALLHAPAMQDFMGWVGAHLRAGFVLTIDYGGAATHCLDPAPALPHLRVFPEPEAGAGRDWISDLRLPGRQDVTVDIDFSHLAYAGLARGLEVVAFLPQGDLARGPEGLGLAHIDPLARDERARVVKRLKARGIGEISAQQKAYETARSFALGSAGFRALVQRTRGLAGYAIEVPSDPVLPGELVVLDELPQGLLPKGAEAALRREGDPSSDLEHAGLRAERHALVATLLKEGRARRAAGPS